MTETRKHQIAKRNARIFTAEWCQKAGDPVDGAVPEVFQFPLFDFYVESVVSDQDLLNLSELAITYLADSDQCCAERETGKEDLLRFVNIVVPATDHPDEFFTKTAVQSLNASNGLLHAKSNDQLFEALHKLYHGDERHWTERDFPYLCKMLFLITAITAGEMDDLASVDSAMEFLLKQFLFLTGKRISQEEFLGETA